MTHSSGYGTVVPVHLGNTDRMIKSIKTFTTRSSRHPTAGCNKYSVCLYPAETWPLTLREERRLRMFENGVLRVMFGAKRNRVAGEWRKLHNEQLNDLYSSTNIIRVIK
jgi:hypothetical protein